MSISERVNQKIILNFEHYPHSVKQLLSNLESYLKKKDKYAHVNLVK